MIWRWQRKLNDVNMRLFVHHFNSKHRPSREQCRCIVRRILESNFGDDQIELLHNQFGQPQISDSSKHISYSHSGSLLVLALSDKPIGVDTENRSREKELLEIKNTAFSDQELLELNDPLHIWCLKEAAMKMIGRGFYDNEPSELSVVCKTNNKFAITDKSVNTLVNGQFFDIMLDDDLICICCNDDEIIEEIITVDKKELLCTY